MASRKLLVASAVVTAAVGWVFAPTLASGDEVITWCYRVMFVTCVASFVGTPYIYSLQATSIQAWNAIRVSQPLAYLAVVTVTYLAGDLTVQVATMSLAATLALQTGVAVAVWYRNSVPADGIYGRTARPLLGYGFSQLASAIPGILVARLDQLVLSLAAGPAALGHYAVALTLTNIALPIVASIGNVAFPRIASQALPLREVLTLERAALVVSAASGIAAMITLSAIAPWLVPLIFGGKYHDAIVLVWLLAPGGALLACTQVCADLLRARGAPLAVALSQGVSAAFMIGGIAVLLPNYGVRGAAVASSLASAIAMASMLISLRRERYRRRRTVDDRAVG